MRVRLAPFAAAVLSLGLAIGARGPLARGEGETGARAGSDAESARILHLLRRATFGPRTEDVEEVRRLGREAWVDRQLRPEEIPDREVDERLGGYESLGLSTSEYLARLDAGPAPPRVPGRGENPDEVARRRVRDVQRLRSLGAKEVPESVLLRAVYSRRQLQQVMCEFWRNHFNVDVNKDDVRYYVADWEREVLQKRVFGSFEDLLLATARHPAMLFYLDNHVSQAPRARGEKVLQGHEKQDRTDGLNENYARELMELHTVGVDNGYTQDDVIQLALVLTGWSIGGQGGDRGAFTFRAGYHAGGRKRVMGKTVKDGGVEEGEEVLRYLAHHPNTRRFVCTKLVRYLVADDPPPAIVDAAVAAWKKTKGDLGAVVRAILLHPDFDAPGNVLAKARTPFEMVAATLRATRADVKDPGALLARLADMDEPLYQCQDPTGYSDRAADWTDAGALAVRWTYARDLVDGRIPGVSIEDSPIFALVRDGPPAWEDALVGALFAGQTPSLATLAPIRRRLVRLEPGWRTLAPDARVQAFRDVVTLMLGSTDFQRQ